MPVALGHCTIDLGLRVVGLPCGEAVRLSAREVDLLRYLIARPGEPVSREQLLCDVWGYSDRVLSRACDNTVLRIRAKIEEDPSHPAHLLTVHGHGYQWTHQPAEQMSVPVAPPLRLGERWVDLARHQVAKGEQTWSLSAKEVAVFEVLVAANGAVVDVSQLARQSGISPRSVGSVLHRLRAKVEEDPGDARFIRTERGAGVRLVLPDVPRVLDADGGLRGRTQALEGVARALDTSGWVLITGPPGVGKSRVARRIAAEWGQAAWWVDAAPAVDEEGLVAAVEAALEIDVGVGPGRLTRVARRLATMGPGLVVIDNLEQCTAAARAVVGEVRSAAPELRWLGTSRRRVGASHEHCIELQPLPVDEGVALFLDRAAAAGARVPSDRREMVRSIVRGLSGLPLAVELAAGWTATLSATDLADRLGLVLGRPGDADGVLAAFEPSMASLADHDAEALLGLALFRGPFSLADAHGVLGVEAAAVVRRLRDHSVLAREPHHAEAWFRVLVPIRELATHERSRRADGGRRVELAWADWVVRREPAARESDLVAALSCARRWSAHELAARAVIAALSVRREARLGPDWDALVDSLAPQVPPELEGELREAHAAFLCDHRQLDRGIPRVEGLLGSLLDAPRRARLWSVLGSACSADPQRSAEAYEQAVAAFTEAGQGARAAVCEGFRALSGAPYEGRPPLQALRDAAQEAQCLGDPALQAHAEQLLGRLHQERDGYVLAAEHFGRAVASSRAVGTAAQLLSNLTRLGEVRVVMGDIGGAEQALHEVLERSAALGTLVWEPTAHTILAEARAVAGDVAGALAAIEDARRTLAQTPDNPAPMTHAFLDLREARLMLVAADAGSAQTLATLAREAYVELGVDEGIGFADAVLAVALAHQGEHQQAQARAEAALTRWPDDGSTVQRALLVTMRGQVAHAAGRSEAARGDVAEARRLMRACGGLGPASELSRAIEHVAAEL